MLWEVFSKFWIEIIAPHFPKRFSIGELRIVLGVRESNSKQNGRTVKDDEKVLESFKIFVQTYGVFNGLVVGFGPKWMPGRMCNSMHYLKCGHTSKYISCSPDATRNICFVGSGEQNTEFFLLHEQLYLGIIIDYPQFFNNWSSWPKYIFALQTQTL